MLERAPTLVNSIYVGDAYHGENALHMAIANADLAEARFLVSRSPTLIYGHADGAFFARGASAYYGRVRRSPLVKLALLLRWRPLPGRHRTLPTSLR